MGFAPDPHPRFFIGMISTRPSGATFAGTLDAERWRTDEIQPREVHFCLCVNIEWSYSVYTDGQRGPP